LAAYERAHGQLPSRRQLVRDVATVLELADPTAGSANASWRRDSKSGGDLANGRFIFRIVIEDQVESRIARVRL